jgi:hypothetical protein
MGNRVFVGAVVVLWLGSMSWLMIDKVLPSFYDGEPPIAAGFEPNVPVAWSVFWADRFVGHAASVRNPGLSGTTDLENRVQLDDVPLLDLLPPLMRQVVGDIGRMKLDAYTKLEFDSLDNFSAFESRVSINDISSLLELHGRMQGAYLNLKVKLNTAQPYKVNVFISNEAALSEALFPDAKLPYMYPGRRWTEDVYSPFRSPSDPVDSVEVEVTGQESIEYGGATERVLRVEYRGTQGPGIPEEARLQAVAWVRPVDGLVLKQEVYVNNSTLTFVRLPDDRAAEVGRQLLTDRRNYPTGMLRGGSHVQH